jgi:Zn-finger nucleic acid-binding protein
MQCPKCANRELAAATVRGIEVDRCPHCRGIWFDVHELARLLAMAAGELKPIARGDTNADADARAGHCPRDRSQMIRVCSARKHTVILETCPACRGLWLDGGELAELLSA